jgi:hypothetical protein
LGCRRRTNVLDLLVICALVAFPALLYVGGLGFYSDDWRFLSVLSLNSQQGFVGAVGALAPELGARPPHLLLLAGLFQVSGLNPLGYHLAGLGLLLVSAVLMYLALLELRFPRALGFGVCAVFVALPQYSTDRFWTAAIQADIGLAFFCLGTYAALRALHATRAWGAWLVLAAAGLVTSVLAYEVFLGTAVLVPVLILIVHSRQKQPGSSARAATLAVVLAASILGVVAFKLTTTTRLPEFASLLARARWLAAVMRDGGLVGFGGYGIGLPFLALDAAVKWPDGPRLIMGVCVGILAGAWGYRLVDHADWSASLRALILGGIVVFVAGLAIFASNYAFGGTLSGSANRTMIASAIGVAATLTGVVGVLASWRMLRRAAVFAVGIGLICLSGTVLNLTLASFWVDAAREQTQILRSLRAVAPMLPNNATVLLAGVCPYLGPGVVFEAPWDLAGALQIAYSDPTLRADVVTPRLETDDSGVTTEIYGERSFYPYTQMFVFDASSGALVEVSGRDAFERALAASESSITCAPGQPGFGQPVF